MNLGDIAYIFWVCMGISPFAILMWYEKQSWYIIPILMILIVAASFYFAEPQFDIKREM